MTVSMYQLSVPIFIRSITSMSNCLDKAIVHAGDNKNFDMDFVLNMRFYPDMFSFKRQLQQATMWAADACSVLAGIQPVSMPNTESTVADLQARLSQTVDYLSGFSRDQIDGTEEKQVTLRVGSSDRTFRGQQLLLNFILPNFYFHCTTAYDILRHCGVPLQKRDFMGKPIET